jgi:hypothetical protein
MTCNGNDERTHNLEEILARSFDQLAKEFFSVKHHAYCQQVFYMQYHLFFVGETTVHQFNMH